MSTRSGKRIHGSIHENAVNDVIEVKSERKTRGKRLVENCVEIATEKKRKHYVRYPSEEDLAAASNGAYNKEKIPKSARKSQKNTLKEPNILATDSETSNDDRSGRRTRRTRKAEAVDTAENIDPNNEIKIKSKGKNKTKSLIVNDDNTFETEIHTIKKKSNKKKHKRNSGSVDIVNDIIPQTTDGKNNLSCMSVDSFYSAAGSPVKEYHKIDNNLKILDMPSKSTRSHDKVIENEVEDHQVQDIPLKATRRSKNHEKKGKLQEIPLKATRSNEKYCEEIVERDQIQEMPSKATRSKMHSLKNISLEDADSKTTKSKGTKRKRKLTDEKAFNNSLTKTTNDDVNNFSKVGILPIIQITDCGVTQDTQHTNSFSSSPGFNNSLKNSNKKRRSKTNSTNDKVENSSTFEIETVNNIKTPDKLLKIDTSKGNSAKKNSSYDTINDNINTTFDKEISKNSVNQTDKSQDVLAKGIKDSLKKKRKSTIDINNVSEANLVTTFGKEITNYFVNHSEHVQDDSTNINGTKSNNRRKTNSTSDKIKADTITNLNATFEKEIIDSINHSDYSQDDSTNRNSTKKSNKKKTKSTYDKIRFSETSSNSTFDEKTPQKPINESVESHQNVSTSDVKNKKKSSIKESISDKMVIDTSIINLDATYEKDNSYLNQQTVHNNARETTPRKSGQCSTFQDQGQDIQSNLNTTYDKNSINGSQHMSLNNSTFDKSAKFNTTFEMVKNTKLDATFEKSQNNDARRGSSLISSDTTDNVSSEMSKDISRVSITSDESVMDNFVNTTPVLIESSVDESQINISSNENKIMPVDAQTKNVSPPLKLQKEYEETRYVSTHEGTSTENTKTPPKSEETLTDKKTYVTPLKKDGTYTEIKYDTPPKREGIFTKKKGSTTPKDKGVFTETKGQNTPKAKESFEEDKGSTTPSRERTYTKLKTPITPLKREGTYTELNPKSTPPQNNTNTENKTKTPIKLNGLVVNKLATPPLNREDTFTKDSDVPESPKVKFDVNKTPTRRKSLPSPGRTPFPLSKSASKETERSEQSVLNITRSAEKSKRRSSMVDLVQRATKVMFCSPVDTPMVTGQKKGTVIKSNLKGSDKSFLFDESVSDHGRPPRKRSYTQSEADGLSSKRKRLTHDQQQSVERLARPRTASASGKLQDPGTPSKRASTLNKSRTEVTPSKAKAEGRVLRTRLPNFAALHQKRFAKMESLDECQLRKAKRARQLLTPTGPVSVLERISPKEAQSSSSTESQPNKLETSKKTIIPPENQGYTRFGFKLNIDVANPFNFTAKTETKPKEPKEGRLQPPERHTTSLCPLPSRAGATRVRKEAAKQTIMREKSFTDRRDINRKENRTIIKGVRTNRRFELQMQMRNVNQ